MEPRTNAPGRSHGRGRLSRPGLARRGAAGPGEAWRGRARAPGHEQKLPTTLTIRPPAHHWRASARLVRASARAKTTRQEEDTRQPLEQQKTLVVGRKPTGGDIAAESTERPPRAFPAPAPPQGPSPSSPPRSPRCEGGASSTPSAGTASNLQRHHHATSIHDRQPARSPASTTNRCPPRTTYSTQSLRSGEAGPREPLRSQRLVVVGGLHVV